ncbi:hypothetical protein GCM10007387_60620 [Pseudoduganella albidiflava]|uniref:Uncharacterized protein n=1 Tax=Pseudoduganella albidiflava TaxID=321983 RepID=A0AA87Y2W8_9BURK|nr:hypothetical protein GCM10007387_60620 [Pseudoduganella albidiflava]
MPVQYALSGAAIVKVRAAGGAWAALAETQKVETQTRPERRLLFAQGSGTPATYTPPAGWSLLDFTQHPSLEVSAILGTDTEARLLRFDSRGTLLREQAFADPAVRHDAYMDDPIYVRDPDAMLPYVTRDAARLASLGEEAVLALRTGKDAVVAYRFGYGPAGFTQRWRTLVEPGVQLGLSAIIGGGFDPFQSLSNPAHVRLDVSATGRIAIAVQSDRSNLIDGHARHFHETLPAGMAYGLFVTELDAAGTRLGTRVVPMAVRPEVHGVRWVGDTVAVTGRQRTSTPADHAGWDAYVALLEPGQAPRVQLVDVDRCDIVFDLLPLADGRMLAAGTTGYTQNPGGASISETSQPLLAVLDANGAVQQRLPFTAGARQNQVRSLAAWNGGWLAGGLVNGPGTHSGDGDPALIFADGYVREGKL